MVGVTMSVVYTVTVSGSKVSVKVVVVDGVGMDRQEHALETYGEGHSVGI
jgi:hypothetical protein